MQTLRAIEAGDELTVSYVSPHVAHSLVQTDADRYGWLTSESPEPVVPGSWQAGVDQTTTHFAARRGRVDEQFVVPRPTGSCNFGRIHSSLFSRKEDLNYTGIDRRVTMRFECAPTSK